MNHSCEHSDAEHVIAHLCEAMIHYPSEDYPCVCTGFEAGANASVCARCEHSREKHLKVRLCRPAGGDFCACRTVIA